jgi:3D (Asp-Asp-Asp) domain-containing protein
MSKYAVLLLPFFIGSLLSAEPLIGKSSTNSVIENPAQIPVINQLTDQVKTAELLSRNYTKTKIIVSTDYAYAPKAKEPTVIKTLITAYSSCVEETDNTPFITASGNYVRPGVVAANFLPLGTKIRIPEIFGDKVFTVEDRMRRDYNDRVDIWFATKEGALNFGQQISKIEIL